MIVLDMQGDDMLENDFPGAMYIRTHSIVTTILKRELNSQNDLI